MTNRADHITQIKLETIVQAPIGVCFNLSRSIDIHIATMADTRERAVAGRTSGLIQNGETVTWRAVHFLVPMKLTVKITAMEEPYYFCDEMVKGAFRSLRHEHFFREASSGTLMVDNFSFTVPFGWVGKLFNHIILKQYMTNLLLQRNNQIKRVAESGSWQQFLPGFT